MARKFDIPSAKEQSTQGARDAYFSAFGQEWPHGDDDLRDIAKDFQARGMKSPKCPMFVIVMREHSGGGRASC